MGKMEKITLIIPTYNEEKYIARLLGSIAKQTYSSNLLEIFIFDGNSTDHTVKIINDFKKELNISLFANKKKHQVFAFNQGIKKSTAKYFMIIGAHSILDKNYIKSNYDALIKLKNKNVVAVGGIIKNIFDNKFSELVSTMFTSPIFGGSGFRYSSKSDFYKTIVFGLYDKEIVKRAGLFDEDMICGNDFELNIRLDKLEYKLYQNSKTGFKYFNRSSIKKFVKQIVEYGVVKGICIKKKYFNLFWLAPLGFLIYELLLLGSLFTPFFSTLIWILFLYLLILIVATSALLIKYKKFYLVQTIWLFFISHNLVAFGLLKGLLFGKKSFRYYSKGKK